MKNRMTAAMLAFFLGGFGAHKFYLNQTAAGWLYLLFFWTFIPMILALVAFIQFLSMSDDEFNKKYNQGQSSQIDVAEELGKLFELKEKGAITAEEYDAKKIKLMN